MLYDVFRVFAGRKAGCVDDLGRVEAGGPAEAEAEAVALFGRERGSRLEVTEADHSPPEEAP